MKEIREEGVVMHELGVLNQVVKTVGRIAEENRTNAIDVTRLFGGVGE